MSSNTSQTKKFAILFATFVVPLLFFLFLASGKVNFEKLPVLTERVLNISSFTSNETKVSFRDKVSVVVFLGEEATPSSIQKLLNLYQVIYKSTEKYAKFQVVAIVPDKHKDVLKKVQHELEFVGGIDLRKWQYVTLDASNSEKLLSSFEVPYKMNFREGLSEVFIIDETVNLRGRTDDEDTESGVLFGYDMSSVAILKNKLREDLKVVFYESKFAVKEDQL